jgi:hypothetical protein
MTHNITSIPNVENAECKGHQENRKKNISPAFLYSFIIDEQHNKYAQHNTAINKNKKELIKEFVQMLCHSEAIKLGKTMSHLR